MWEEDGRCISRNVRKNRLEWYCVSLLTKKYMCLCVRGGTGFLDIQVPSDYEINSHLFCIVCISSTLILL